MILNEKLKTYHERYIKLLADRDAAHEKVISKSNIFNRSMLQNKYEDATKKFNDYCADVYAKAIFEVYSQIKPKILRARTAEVFGWTEMFGLDFSKLSDIRKSTLVGLVEGTCGYKFV